MSAKMTNWPLSLEQFLALPEAEPGLEMGGDGEISQKVPATTTHSLLQRNIAMSLEVHAAPHRQGHTFIELRVILGRVTRVPDVAFYRQERLPPDAAVFESTQVLALEEVLPGLQLTHAELFAALEP